MSDNCQCCVFPFIAYCLIIYFLFKCFIKFLERGWWILSRKSHLSYHNRANKSSSINLSNGIHPTLNDKSWKQNILLTKGKSDCTFKRNDCKMNILKSLPIASQGEREIGFNRNDPFDMSEDELDRAQCKKCCCLECSCKLTVYRKKKGIMQSVTGKNLKVTYSDQLVYVP